MWNIGQGWPGARRSASDVFLIIYLRPKSAPAYETFLIDLKDRIRTARTRASLAVNKELVQLYWKIGRDILERQQRESWGIKFIERLAQDLRREFPEMKRLSRANLLYMRGFAEAWHDAEIVQRLVGQFPWGQNIELISKVKSREEQEWYAGKVIEHGWSRPVLVHQIESRLYHQQGKEFLHSDLRK